MSESANGQGLGLERVPLANTGDAELLARRAGHFTLDADGLTQIDQLWVR